LLFCATPLCAQNLGTFGQTFPIYEQDLLLYIQQRLQDLAKSGALSKHQKIIQAQSVAQIMRPAATKLDNTKTPRVFYYNPTIKVAYDLKDSNNNVFIKAGTYVNPLAYQKLTKLLLFINGDDDAQVTWALKQYPQKNKIILTQGSPFTLMQKHGVLFYFDQGGALVNKFKIGQLPARISSDGQTLKIEEVLPEDDHAL
jgi:conjugal transfer pilus assembly protein TraW